MGNEVSLQNGDVAIDLDRNLFMSRQLGSDISTENDRMVDNLIYRQYINNENVERAFKLVDRKIFYPEGFKHLAFNHQAWRNVSFGFETPRAYAKIMNQFDMKKGMSFLNVPAGSGYVNTVAGFLLGTYGLNHGLDLSGEALSYAESNLRSFLENNDTVDQKEFCMPIFAKGNVLSMEPQKYDRILCLLTCPQENIMHLKEKLLAVGGILMVFNSERLYKITRVADNIWQESSVFQLAKKSLTLPNVEDQKFTMPKGAPSLMELSRAVIRKTVQQNIEKEKIIKERPLLAEYIRRCDQSSGMIQLKLAAELEAYPDLAEVQFWAATFRGLATKPLPKSVLKSGTRISNDDILKEYGTDVKTYVGAKDAHNRDKDSFRKRVETLPLSKSMINYTLFRQHAPAAIE